MTYTLRSYQKEAKDTAISFFKADKKYNAIEVLPTGSGKSLIIANIVNELNEPVLVFQPSKEILDQNLSKIHAYGYEAAVFSAAKGRKEVANITLATIGSVVGRNNLFENFRYVIIDECHKVNAKEGIYKTFLKPLLESGTKILGLTATPYRLVSNRQESELHFITSTRPRIFHEMICFVQNKTLFDAGYLSRIKYTAAGSFNWSRLSVNDSQADYTDESVFTQLWASNTPDEVIKIINRNTRKNYLVFTRFIKEAQYIVNMAKDAAIVTGDTTKKERERVTHGFRAGHIKTVCNVGVLTTGFDFPELDTVILAKPTMSLALYYQMIGRGIRPHKSKEYTEIIDMCGNYDLFGRIEDLEICQGLDGWHVMSNGRQLTN